MEFTREQLGSAKKRLTNGPTDAPLEVLAAMLHLQSDPDAVCAAIADSEDADGRTTWRAAWLTDERLIFCQASADLPGWDLSSGRPEGTNEAHVDAWMAPLSAVSSVGVDAVRMLSQLDAWSGDVHTEIHVRDRGAVAVPLFGKYPSGRQRESCGTFLRELVARVRPRFTD